MSLSFTKKSVAEVLVLLAGAGIAAAGKAQESSLLLGLGVVIIGIGVILGGLGAIRRRRLVFLHEEARFTTHRVTGAAAVLWGVLFLLMGVALLAGGIGIALGREAALRGLLTQPGAWLLGGGIAVLFVSAAALAQRAADGGHDGLRILLALPGYAFSATGLLLGAGLAAAGAWGLQDPAGLAALAAKLTAAAEDWLDTI